MKKLLDAKKILTRKNILAVLLALSALFVIGDIAFSIPTYHDNIAAIITILYFIYYVIAECKINKTVVIQRVKTVFKSAKWIYIALILYIIYDLVTVLYTKEIYYFIQKIPLQLQFMALSSIAMYFLDTKKKITFFIGTVLSTGVIVAAGSYFYYFLTMSPIYFKRLSTARDYNTFSCLLLFSIMFGYLLITHRLKLSLPKRLILMASCMILIMPSFYLAGSRRMAIMLPYFMAFAVVYEIVRTMKLSPKSRKQTAWVLTFLSIIVVAYVSSIALLDPFTTYGEKKEISYKEFIIRNKDNPQVTQPKKPIKAQAETTIGEMLKTIDNKSMLSKRSLIYSVAFTELMAYNPAELIFGRGASYDMYMYYTTDDQALIEAYKITEDNPRSLSFLSVHNFMLSDLLNGGLIKLLLGIFLVVQIIIHLVKMIKKDNKIGVTLILSTFLVLANNSISGSYGLINDVFFHIVIVLLVSSIALSREENVDDENLYNDKCSPAQRCQNLSQASENA